MTQTLASKGFRPAFGFLAKAVGKAELGRWHENRTTGERYSILII